MDTTTGALTGLSADYSDDELDAIALLLDRPLLAARKRLHPPTAVERAVNEAALRGLVARRALVLEGTEQRRRVRFLEPHRSLLDPFVAARTTIAIWVHRPSSASATAFFLHGEEAVRQSALPGMAIKRMALLTRSAAAAEALSALALEELTEAPAERREIELAPRTWNAAEAAVTGEEESAAPTEALDLLHARTATVEMIVNRGDGDGTRIQERLEWLTAGSLGPWTIEPGDGDPPATVSVTPREPGEIRAEAEALLRSAIDAPG